MTVSLKHTTHIQKLIFVVVGYSITLTLNKVYLIPHGDEILDQPNENSRKMSEHISRVVSNDSADTIIILSPHGLSLSNSFGIINTQYIRADLRLKKMRIRKIYQTDRDIVKRIVSNSSESQEVSFSTSTGPKSVLPLDFGSVIPLTFFSQNRIVAIGQPRIWNRALLQDFGKLLVRISENAEKSVSIVISADQAHTHSPAGPYGFAEESAVYENLVEECVSRSDLTPLIPLREEFIMKAKPDSYWNLLVLKGIMEETGKRTVLDFHYIEEYFGMMLAHLE